MFQVYVSIWDQKSSLKSSIGNTGLSSLFLFLLATLQKVWLHLHKILCQIYLCYWPLQTSNITFYRTRMCARSLGVSCKGTVCVRILPHECGGNKPDTAFTALAVLAFGIVHHARFLVWHSGQTQINLFFLHILKSALSFYYPYCENFHSSNQ